MFDTMTATKAVGAGCGALLIFLLGGWAAEITYHGGGGHGAEGEAVQGYVIEVAAAETTDEPEVDFETLLAAADPAAGEKVFAKCRACHKLDGTNGTGPALNGIVNHPKAAAPGFSYSQVLASMAGETWTPENLNAFLQSPRGYAPGTKMAFNGLPSQAERVNLISWLATQN